MKRKLLLHVCCGPCGTHTINELKKKYDVTAFYYNPNIHPEGEYLRRLANAKKVGDFFKVPLTEADYDVDGWLERIAGMESEPEGGKRCSVCFADRLAATAKYAKEHGFDCFTTTLSISPHKDEKKINAIGEQLAKKHKINWLHSDFKKNDGFKKSIEMSKDLDLYRQKYCGCFYSVKSSIASPNEKNL
jgi:predicted adenine nucleotide alpha hydrolase (AANH) superfamily ATPase